MEITLKIVVEEGAGEDFAAKVCNAIEGGVDSVLIQIAGEYGHLRVTKLRDIEFN